MPRVKCDWDQCVHNDFETGYCMNPEEIELVTTALDIVDSTGKETGETDEYFECMSFKNHEEAELEAKQHGAEGT